MPPKASGASLNWSAIGEAGSVHGIAVLYWIYLRFGRLPFRLILYPLLFWFFLTKPLQRKASREFLSRALRRKSTLGDSFRHFSSFADAMLDKLVAWNDGFRLKDIDFQGDAVLVRKLEAGRGCLLIGSHLGNIEVCRVLSKYRTSIELHVLTHTEHAQNFNRVLKKIAPESAINLHQVTALDAALAARLSERVARGALLLIAGDRVSVNGTHSISVPFLGANAPFATGPYVLAHALGCPVFLLFCQRNRRRFEVSFEPFADAIRLPRGKMREPALAELISRYAHRLGQKAEETPYQWFNFYPYWQAREHS